MRRLMVPLILLVSLGGMSLPYAQERALAGVAPEQAISDVLLLPGATIKVVRATSGEILIVAGERFVVRAPELFDGWTGRRLHTIEEARAAAFTLDLAGLGIDVGALNPLVLGAGAPDVVVFVDPHCPWSAHLLSEIVDNAHLLSSHRFLILTVAALGNASLSAAQKLECNRMAPGIPAALMRQDYERLAVPPDCDLTGLTERQSLFTALALSSVPAMVAPDGRLTYGIPDDIPAWLARETRQ